eukprot:m.180156 g.180156  ORF g.180156 m.180156 type:complete len:419 (-) comp15492_c0_seq7:1121-2377(-)
MLRLHFLKPRKVSCLKILVALSLLCACYMIIGLQPHQPDGERNKVGKYANSYSAQREKLPQGFRSDVENMCSDDEMFSVGLSQTYQVGRFDKFCKEQMQTNKTLSRFQDKSLVSDFFKKIIPSARVAKTYAVVRKKEEITRSFLKSLPSKFVAKSTHGSQMTMFINKDKASCLATNNAKKHNFCVQWKATGDDIFAFVKENCGHWLDLNFGNLMGDQIYSLVVPGCIFEEYLEYKVDTSPLTEVKIFVVAGRPMMGIYENLENGEIDRKVVSADADWHPLPASTSYESGYGLPLCFRGDGPTSDKVKKQVKTYVEVAKALGQFFDAVRVDFFGHESDIILQDLNFLGYACQMRWGPPPVEKLMGYLAYNPKVVSWFSLLTYMNYVNKQSVSPQCLKWVAFTSTCAHRYSTKMIQLKFM